MPAPGSTSTSSSRSRWASTRDGPFASRRSSGRRPPSSLSSSVRADSGPTFSLVSSTPAEWTTAATSTQQGRTMFESECIRRPAVYLTLAALVLGTISVVLAWSTSGAGAASAQQRKPAAAAKPAQGPTGVDEIRPAPGAFGADVPVTTGAGAFDRRQGARRPHSSFAPARPISRRGRSNRCSIGDHEERRSRLVRPHGHVRSERSGLAGAELLAQAQVRST